MELKETTYVNTKNDTKIIVSKLYYQDDYKVCFYGYHIDCNGIGIEHPREYHLTLDKLKYWRELK